MTILLAQETGPHALEQALSFVLLQLAVIIISARWLGGLAIKLGQPRVVGEIIGGLALGPSLLGGIAPKAFHWLFYSTDGAALYFFSQVGLLLLMLQIGMESDFGHLREKANRKAVLAVSFGSVTLPLAGGAILGSLMHPHLAAGVNRGHFCAFVAVALAITALPILGRILADLQLTRTRLGSVTIAAAASNDVIGWVLLAAITALAAARFSASLVAFQLGGIVVFGFFLWLGVKPWLGQLARRSVDERGDLSLDFAALLTGLTFLAALATVKLGIFAIFGGFAVGVLLYDSPEFVAAWRRRLEPFVHFFFLPLFFTFTGLRTDASGLNTPALWGWCMLVIVVATMTKWIGSYLAARWAGLPVAECRSIAVMMNTRALMELVVLNVGHELGIIPQTVFTMLVIMAVVTTVITTPMLRRFLPIVAESATHDDPDNDHFDEG